MASLPAADPGQDPTARILESVSDGLMAFDRDWRFVYVNAAGERLLSLPRAALIGRTLWSVFPVLANTTLEQECRRAVTEQVTLEFENYYEPWERWFAIRVYPSEDQGLAVYFQDITERRSAEQALQQAHQRFLLATAAVKGVVYDWDVRTGRTFRSEGLFDLLGYTPEEAGDLSEWWTDRIHPDDRFHLQQVLDRAINSRATRYEVEYRLRHRDGSYRTVQDRSLLLRDSDRVVRQIGFTTDVTEAVSSRRALDDARVVAESANRAKDDFLAMLGHELRNPLAPILTALQLMRLRGLHSREQDVLERQVGHLTRLVDDLLDVSRITRGKIELHLRPIELADAVVRAMEIVSPLIEQRHHAVDVRVPRQGLVVYADLDRLAQIVSNLLTNAAKYSDAGSRIAVIGEPLADRVRLRVRDTGIGIAPEMLRSIFDAFVQQPQSLERARGGLGLGLTIVRSLTAMHGGTVYVESGGLGHGSEFIVELPALDPARESREHIASDNPRGAAVTAGFRILVVDDNHDAAAMLQVGLEAMGHHVDLAYDGPSAIEKATLQRPEIALLDIGLPIMDGYELAGRLRALAGDSLRLLAVTGYGQESDRERSEAAGFERHLVKPIDLKRLGALIANPQID